VTQRVYRAACPNCGAPVEFASAASASAVCSFCRSTLLRDGDALRRIGIVAELFDDHSPLQLGAAGRLQGQAFTIVGRLQYGYADGTWNEWHALFDNGPGLQRSAWLSDDNGAYVFAFDVPLADPPALGELRAGQRVVVAGQGWDVASSVRARLVSAQGELPHPPRLDGPFTVVDLRNVQGEVGTLDDADPKAVGWSIGRSVALSQLALSGLREVGEKTLAARSVQCPSCGTSLEVKLATTQSIACAQCRAVVDLSQGAGADLAHFAQNNSGEGGLEPQIVLGSSGTLALGGAPLAWQVVGYLERCSIEGDERRFWREYLLYDAGAGFAFLVDAEDGWSWVRPITGAPALQGSRADWQGVSYKRQEGYPALVTWVQGEFYWRVRRDERALVTDYAAGRRRLSREQTGDEVTWSAGEVLDSTVVAAAFGVRAAAPLARDVAPTSSSAIGVGRALLIVIAIVAVLFLVGRCSSRSDECAAVRSTFGEDSSEFQQCQRSQVRGSTPGSSGGAYGGWSSGGGGHK
jgi:endogenous inhibitor of DNA gyrase (YacG/DUF329 family)